MEKHVQKFENLISQFSLDTCDSFEHTSIQQSFNDALKEAERIINKVKNRKEDQEKQEKLQKEKEAKEKLEKEK